MLTLLGALLHAPQVLDYRLLLLLTTTVLLGALPHAPQDHSNSMRKSKIITKGFHAMGIQIAASALSAMRAWLFAS